MSLVGQVSWLLSRVATGHFWNFLADLWSLWFFFCYWSHVASSLSSRESQEKYQHDIAKLSAQLHGFETCCQTQEARNRHLTEQVDLSFAFPKFWSIFSSSFFAQSSYRPAHNGTGLFLWLTLCYGLFAAVPTGCRARRDRLSDYSAKHYQFSDKRNRWPLLTDDVRLHRASNRNMSESLAHWSHGILMSVGAARRINAPWFIHTCPLHLLAAIISRAAFSIIENE